MLRTMLGCLTATLLISVGANSARACWWSKHCCCGHGSSAHAAPGAAAAPSDRAAAPPAAATVSYQPMMMVPVAQVPVAGAPAQGLVSQILGGGSVAGDIGNLIKLLGLVKSLRDRKPDTSGSDEGNKVDLSCITSKLDSILENQADLKGRLINNAGIGARIGAKLVEIEGNLRGVEGFVPDEDSNKKPEPKPDSSADSGSRQGSVSTASFVEPMHATKRKKYYAVYTGE